MNHEETLKALIKSKASFEALEQWMDNGGSVNVFLSKDIHDEMPSLFFYACRARKDWALGLLLNKKVDTSLLTAGNGSGIDRWMYDKDLIEGWVNAGGCLWSDQIQKGWNSYLNKTEYICLAVNLDEDHDEKVWEAFKQEGLKRRKECESPSNNRETLSSIEKYLMFNYVKKRNNKGENELIKMGWRPDKEDLEDLIWVLYGFSTKRIREVLFKKVVKWSLLGAVEPDWQKVMSRIGYIVGTSEIERFKNQFILSRVEEEKVLLDKVLKRKKRVTSKPSSRL